MSTTTKDFTAAYAATSKAYQTLSAAMNASDPEGREGRVAGARAEVARAEEALRGAAHQQDEYTIAEDLAEAVAEAISAVCEGLEASVWAPDRYTARVYLKESGGPQRDRGHIHFAQECRPEHDDEDRVYITDFATRESEAERVARAVVGDGFAD